MTAARKRYWTIAVTLLVALLCRCESKQPPAPVQPAAMQLADIRGVRRHAARILTERYAHSRLSGWHVQARAAGLDCEVLVVEPRVVMDDTLIEAMHYGAGVYDIYDGGIQHFCRERDFRGVVYKDPSARLWTYGAVTMAEAEMLPPCL